MVRRFEFAIRTLVVVGITALTASLLLLAYYVKEVVLLGFAGILLAIFLRSVSDWLSSFTGLSRGWSLGIIVLFLAGLVGVGTWLAFPRLANQAGELAEQVPRDLAKLRQRVEDTPWGHRLLALAPQAGRSISNSEQAVTRVTDFASKTIGAIGSLLVVLFVGLYLAYEPDLYRNGLLRLIPIARRRRAAEVLDWLVGTLRSWLVGRAITMVATGVLTWLGLWLLGIPFALTLGVLAGLFNLIPYIGAILSAIPALLVAMTQGQWRLLAVLLLFAVVQAIEGYLITPLVQRKAIAMPPALQILVQIAFGALAGVLGILLATPILACLIVLTKMLYVEDILGDRDAVRDDREASQGRSDLILVPSVRSRSQELA
jgi:predicted PurR-regulated permease PerM